LCVSQTRVGYRWFVRSKVIHGEETRADLGYPTATWFCHPIANWAWYYAVSGAQTGWNNSITASPLWNSRPQFDNGAPLLWKHSVFDFSRHLMVKC